VQTLPEWYIVDYLKQFVHLKYCPTLMTIETEVNGDSKTTKERGPSLVGSWGLSCQYKIYLSCLDCSNSPVQNMFFLTLHYFNSFILIAQQAGQAVVLGRQCLSVSLICTDELERWPFSLSRFKGTPSQDFKNMIFILTLTS
jgi:hypothetical protein